MNIARHNEMHRAAFFLTVYVVAGLIAAWSYVGELDTWVAVHWLFTYEYGFVKRALVGSILSSFSNPPSFEFIYATALTLQAVATLLLATVAAVVSWCIIESADRTSPRYWWFSLSLILVFLSGPGLIQQLYFDTGRFDVIGIILICIAFFAVRYTSSMAAFYTVIAISAVAILTHEAYSFWVAPLALGFWYWRQHAHTSPLPKLILSAVLLGLLVFLVGTSDYSDKMSFDQALSNFREMANFDFHASAVLVQFRDLESNLLFTSSRAWSGDRLANFVQGASVLSLILAMNMMFLMTRLKRVPLQNVSIIAVCLAPLFLIPLGEDHGRWFAMSSASIAFASLAFIDAGPRVRTELIPRLTILFVGATVVQLGLGAFGVIDIFPNQWFAARL